MELFLLLLSGIAWSVVYIDCIRQGFRAKTYAMPLYALGLNIAWETIYTIHDLLFDVSVQAFVNLAWMCLDAVIVYTYFEFGRREFPERAKKYFVPFSILSFAACAVIQLAFFLAFDPLPAAQYSAFAQNAAMSILFVVMLFRRNSTRGQSMTIAVAKWIGTLAPTVLQGVVWGFNPYIVLMGLVCSVFDILYIILLPKFPKAE
ncbi:MAG: hypothetical protein IJ751_10010 [Oscillospiraceae bacterium]|nr:hypothetical protein [Oscillospiraceae bacterium]